MTLEPRDRLIVALDVSGLPEAEALLERLGGLVSTFKVGGQPFTAAGPRRRGPGPQARGPRLPRPQAS